MFHQSKSGYLCVQSNYYSYATYAQWLVYDRCARTGKNAGEIIPFSNPFGTRRYSQLVCLQGCCAVKVHA